MLAEQEKPILFIFQDGFRQISLPPEQVNWRNREVINLTYCEDGVLIKTEQPHEEVVEKLNKFVGRKIVNVYCDTNDIAENERPFLGARIDKNEYGGEVIYIRW